MADPCLGRGLPTRQPLWDLLYVTAQDDATCGNTSGSLFRALPVRLTRAKHKPRTAWSDFLYSGYPTQSAEAPTAAWRGCGSSIGAGLTALGWAHQQELQSAQMAEGQTGSCSHGPSQRHSLSRQLRKSSPRHKKGSFLQGPLPSPATPQSVAFAWELPMHWHLHAPCCLPPCQRYQQETNPSAPDITDLGELTPPEVAGLP